MIGHHITKVREARRDLSLNEFETFLSAQRSRVGLRLGSMMSTIAYANGRGSGQEYDRDDSWFDPETCDLEVRK